LGKKKFSLGKKSDEFIYKSLGKKKDSLGKKIHPIENLAIFHKRTL